MNTSPRRVLPTAFLCLLFLACTCLSQDLDRAVIYGTVLDPHKALIPNAKITATSTESGSSASQKSDSKGAFRFASLPPGRFVVEAAADGFQSRKSAPFEVLSGSKICLDLTLVPLGVSAEQNVDATATVDGTIETSRTIIGDSLTDRAVSELPSARSEIFDFVLLFGGVSDSALSTRDLVEDADSSVRVTPLEQGSVSLSGGTSYSNNVTIDGLDNNDDTTSRERFSPPIASVAELQVVRNQFSAEYGRASGGRINVVTRSGTGRLRGSAYLRGRDDRLDANSYYNKSRGIARPTLRDRRAALFVSGPIIGRDAAFNSFFSVAYEFQRTGDATLLDTFVPLTGNLRFALPSPNRATTFCESGSEADCAGTTPSSVFIAPYISEIDTPNTNHSLTLRMDSRLRNKKEITVSMHDGWRKLRRTSGYSLSRTPDALQASAVSTPAFNLSLLTYGRRYVNQSRFQWSSLAPGFLGEGDRSPVVIVAFKNPLTGASSSLVAGNSNASTLQNFAEKRRERRFQIQEAVTFISRDHTLKGGFDAQWIRSRAEALTDGTGTFNFPSMTDFSRNSLSRFRQNFGTRSDVRNFYGGVFLNDEIRMRDNLNISFGVRYERESAVRDLNDFGPRVGIAWDPIGNGEDVIRFGAGIFYNRVLLRTAADFSRSRSGTIGFDTNLIGTSSSDARRVQILRAIAERFPNGFSSAQDIASLLTSTSCGASPCSSSLGFVSLNSSSLPARMIDEHIRIPESRQMNIGYERRLAKGLILEANFTVNSTRGLWREYDSNAPTLPSGFEDWTEWLVANPFVFRNSNGNTRTYVFYKGLPTDPSVSNRQGASGTCSTTATVVCFVNLNSTSSGTSSPSTATADSSNAIGSPIGIASAAIARFRPDQNSERRDTIASIGRAFYEGVVFDLKMSERNLFGGIKGWMRASYTLSSQKDDGLNNTSNAQINGEFHGDWARGLQDRRHRGTLVGIFRMPQPLGRAVLTPVLRIGTSAPFNLGTGIDRNLDGSNTDRPSFTGGQSRLVWRRPGSLFPEAIFSGLSLPTIGARGGNLPRNAGIGPRLFVFDMNISRSWRLNERFHIKPNIEAGNIFNTTVFSYGAEYIDFTPTGSNPTASQQAARDRFLVPTRTLKPREIKVGMRLEF